MKGLEVCHSLKSIMNLWLKLSIVQRKGMSTQIHVCSPGSLATNAIHSMSHGYLLQPPSFHPTLRSRIVPLYPLLGPDMKTSSIIQMCNVHTYEQCNTHNYLSTYNINELTNSHFIHIYTERSSVWTSRTDTVNQTLQHSYNPCSNHTLYIKKKDLKGININKKRGESYLPTHNCKNLQSNPTHGYYHFGRRISVQSVNTTIKIITMQGGLDPLRI